MSRHTIVDYDINITRKKLNEIQKQITAKKKVGVPTFSPDPSSNDLSKHDWYY